MEIQRVIRFFMCCDALSLSPFRTLDRREGERVQSRGLWRQLEQKSAWCPGEGHIHVSSWSSVFYFLNDHVSSDDDLFLDFPLI